MQRTEGISLNAVRIFAVTAEIGSIKLAAARLGVTPGAVSRQVQNLETALGVSLFHRTNNSLRLTAEGESFFHEASPGLKTIHRAVDSALGRDQTLAVKVPITLATRWLIPKLEDFKRRRPGIGVTVETFGGSGPTADGRSDVTLAYRRITEESQRGDVLLEDCCRPYISPLLLSEIADLSDLSSIPALQSTIDNWDWHSYLRTTDKSDVVLRFAGRFDLDDIALRAAISGAGMVLASEVLVRDDVAAGLLCPLPEAADAILGHYTMHTSNPASAPSEAFVRWLRRQT